MSTKTIVFIHGLHMTRHCWDQWHERYTARGYTCHAVAWPGRDLPVEQLKARHPDSTLARLTLAEVVDHHRRYIHELTEAPIIIGHSMGGLITQILLQENLAVAGVALDSAPPLGVLTTKWSFLKSNWPVFNPFASLKKSYYMPFEAFQYAFVNGLPLKEQQAVYQHHAVPESLRAARGALTGLAIINFKQAHVPLLFIAGTRDHIIPASLVRSNYARYKHAASVTDFKEYPERTHFLLGQSGWQEIADDILMWLEKQAV